MMSVFQFMKIWDKLSDEEKEFLEHFGWSEFYFFDEEEQKEVTEIHQSLMDKGILRLMDNWGTVVGLQLGKDVIWLFHGLSITSRIG